MSQPVPSSPGDEPQSALLLTEVEWGQLADICKIFCILPLAPEMMPDHAELADRLIKASEA